MSNYNFFMQRTSVNSSNIVSIGYDPDTQTLEIEFHGNSIYQYSSVPQHVHDGIMGAHSHGKYFHSHIKDIYLDQKVS